MQLDRIEILDFKNIAEASLEFCPGLNCLVGLNGMGKSNLLEAIHMLCLAKGFSHIPESTLIRHGSEMSGIKGEFGMENGSRESVAVGLARGKSKSMKRNGKEYPRLSEHIGAFPLVCVTPADSAVVTGGAEERRRLMDIVISQADAKYLSHLIRYGKALENRNKLLRAGVSDPLLFESVEALMEEESGQIHIRRQAWVKEISPILRNFYALIAGNGERADIEYRSILNERSLREVLAESRAKDLALGFTSKGIHRDDLGMSLGEWSMRRIGSQGQIKSFTLALRLAIFEYLKNATGIMPILLLDDIFDKLDSRRVEHILRMVADSEGGFGQIFITDTNRLHIDNLLDNLLAQTGRENRLFEVEEGRISVVKK